MKVLMVAMEWLPNELETSIGGTPETLQWLDAQLVFASPSLEAMADRLCAVRDGTQETPNRVTCRGFVKHYAWPHIAPRMRAVFDDFTRAPSSHGHCPLPTG